MTVYLDSEYYPIRSTGMGHGVMIPVTLTGGAEAILDVWYNIPAAHDATETGVLADRLDEYPEESEGPGAPLLLWFMRDRFLASCGVALQDRPARPPRPTQRQAGTTRANR